MAETGSSERLKVFISYSRRDSTDFAAGEDGEARFATLTRKADTVVFVVSPEAVKSERCNWEVNKALAETKRLLPVIFKPVADADIPQELQRRQFVRFDTGLGINRPLAQLAEALRQDLDWIREHTRLGELAGRWEARGHPDWLLLRGDDLVSAQSWADRRKPEAPAITDSIRAFIAASGQAETADFARSKAAHRRVRWAQVFAALCALALVVAIAGWWKQTWMKESMYELMSVHELAATQERTLKPKDSFQECTDC